MTISVDVIVLLLLSLPGFFAVGLVESVSRVKRYGLTERMTLGVMVSAMAYLGVAWLHTVIEAVPNPSNIITAAECGRLSGVISLDSLAAVGLATSVSLIIALVWVVVRSHRIVPRLACTLHLSCDDPDLTAAEAAIRRAWGKYDAELHMDDGVVIQGSIEIAGVMDDESLVLADVSTSVDEEPWPHNEFCIVQSLKDVRYIRMKPKKKRTPPGWGLAWGSVRKGSTYTARFLTRQLFRRGRGERS